MPQNPEKNPTKPTKRGNPCLIPGNPGNSGGKKGRSGRPPDWLKQVMAKGRTKAVVQLRQRMKDKELDNDQLLKLVKEWAPEADRVTGAKVTVSPDGTVVLDLGSA